MNVTEFVSKLEPEAGFGLRREHKEGDIMTDVTLDPAAAIAFSFAVSAKRIADTLEKLDVHAANQILVEMCHGER
jgi:hypothetical protein